jgi:hypothetical protein
VCGEGGGAGTGDRGSGCIGTAAREQPGSSPGARAHPHAPTLRAIAIIITKIIIIKIIVTVIVIVIAIIITKK